VNTTELPPNYEIHIRPNQSWFSVDWKGLCDYRDLLFLLVRRDFVSRYQQTILGPLWFIINPLVSALMNVIVLHKIIGVQTDGVPPTLFFLAGQITWGYFSSILDTTGNTFTANAHLFGKVYFPRLVVPLAQALSNLINFGIQLLTFLALWSYLKWGSPGGPSFQFNWSVLALFPVFLLHMAALGLGAGMIISAFTAKYRDFRYLTGFLQQIWMMASAVMYPLSILFAKLPEKWHWLVVLNPMACIVEGTRVAFLGAGTFVPIYYVASGVLSIVIFFVGLMLFQRSARTFVDVI
jgi:lipopolysaccharide transport system permease protein